VPDILTEVMNYLKMSPGVDKLLPMSAKLQALGDSSVTVAITVSPPVPCSFPRGHSSIRDLPSTAVASPSPGTEMYLMPAYG